MDKNELIGQIDKAYKDLQCINVQPTKSNMSILMNTMAVLEKVYEFMQNLEDEPEVEVNAE